MAKAVGDSGFFEFQRQLTYKARWYGMRLIIVPRFFPSSKGCVRCGHMNSNLTLATQWFICARCGFTADRNLNASYNLAWVAAS